MRPSSSAPVSARTIGQQAMFAFTTSRTILTTLTRAMVYMLTEYCKSEFEQCVPVVGLWLTMEASGIRANYSIKGSTMLFGWTLSLSSLSVAMRCSFVIVLILMRYCTPRTAPRSLLSPNNFLFLRSRAAYYCSCISISFFWHQQWHDGCILQVRRRGTRRGLDGNSHMSYGTWACKY